MPTFVLTPLTYLGGVFYALSLLPPFWQVVSKLNPIVYMISGFRYGFLGIHDVPLAQTFAVLLGFIAVLYLMAWYLIERGAACAADRAVSYGTYRISWRRCRKIHHFCLTSHS